MDDAAPRAFGIILEYKSSVRQAVGAGARPNAMRDVARAGARVGFIGAGNFTRATLIPAFVSAGAELVAVASSSGLTASDAAQRFGIRRADDAEAILGADDIDAVVIGTRHGSHATLVAAALRAGKAVFVEKPLALSSEELDDVEVALAQSNLPLMVGFNRRFAPLSLRLRQQLEGFADKVVSIRVSAGPLPTDHWLHDPDDGGGRLLGEGCHFVDLVSHLAASPIVAVQAFAVPQAERPLDCSDSFTANIRLADGGVGSVVYSGGGDVRLPKERIEAFGGGIAAVLDDFRRLEIRSGGSRHVEKRAQDKGHQGEVSAFVSVVRGIQPPPHVSTYLNSSRATLALARSLRTQSIVEVE